MGIDNLRDRNWLFNVYHNQGLSISGVASLCGCCPSNVSYWLRKHGIERRSQRDGSGQPKKDIGKEYLLTEYWQNLRSQKDIAKELGVSISTIHYRLKEFNIPIRPKNFEVSRETLLERYINQKQDIVTIANDLGCSPQTVFNKLNKFSIPIRPFAEKIRDAIARGCYSGEETFRKKSAASSGANNGNWKGGQYKDYYGPNWVGQRRLARERDNYTCRRCHVTEIESGQQLDVHHLVAFCVYGLVNYEEANRLDNLICYCKSCHTIIERRGIN